MACIYSEILLSHKKQKSAICSNMDGHSEYYTEWNVRHMKTNIVWYHLYVESKKKKIQTNVYAIEKQSHRCRK